MAETLDRFRQAGIAVDDLPEAAQGILGDLSDDEVDTLISVNERIQAAGGEGAGLRGDNNGYIGY